MTPGDPIHDAERQMAERMTDIFKRATSKLGERMKDRAYTDAELEAALLELAHEDPEFREHAESIGTFFGALEMPAAEDG